MAESGSGRLRRLAEELDESGLVVDSSVVGQILLEEIDRALRPPVHERRVVSGRQSSNQPPTRRSGPREHSSSSPAGSLATNHCRTLVALRTGSRAGSCGVRTIKTNGSSSIARPAPSGISS